MAKATWKMPTEFLDDIAKLDSRIADSIIPRVLEAGGKVALTQVRSNLQSVVGRNVKRKSRSSGELVSALGLSKARLDRRGNYDVKIGFREPRGRGRVSNAMLANILEYGKHGQPPKPFLRPAKTASRKPAIEAMKRKLEEEINKI